MHSTKLRKRVNHRDPDLLPHALRLLSVALVEAVPGRAALATVFSGGGRVKSVGVGSLLTEAPLECSCQAGVGGFGELLWVHELLRVRHG